MQRRPPSQLGFVYIYYIYIHIYVVVVSHTQEYNYRLRSTHVRRSHSRPDRATLTEGGTELEAKAEECELEGPVRCTCEDMELEEGEVGGGGRVGGASGGGQHRAGGRGRGGRAGGGRVGRGGRVGGAAELEATLSHSLPPFS